MARATAPNLVSEALQQFDVDRSDNNVLFRVLLHVEKLLILRGNSWAHAIETIGHGGHALWFSVPPFLPCLPFSCLALLIMSRIHTYITWLILLNRIIIVYLSEVVSISQPHPSTKGYFQRNWMTTISSHCCWKHHHLLTRLEFSLCQLLAHASSWLPVSS